MLIDSDEVHEKIRQRLESYADYPSITVVLSMLGAEITDIELEQAAKNAKHKYALALQGLQDR